MDNLKAFVLLFTIHVVFASHLQHSHTIPIEGYETKLQVLGQHIEIPETPVKVIRITKTVAVKIPVPYPVKIKEKVPYAVHVAKPYPVPVPQIIKVPHVIEIPQKSNNHEDWSSGNYQGSHATEGPVNHYVPQHADQSSENGYPNGLQDGSQQYFGNADNHQSFNLNNYGGTQENSQSDGSDDKSSGQSYGFVGNSYGYGNDNHGKSFADESKNYDDALNNYFKSHGTGGDGEPIKQLTNYETLSIDHTQYH